LSFGVKAAEQTEVQTKDAATEGKHWRRFSFRFLSWLFPVFFLFLAIVLPSSQSVRKTGGQTASHWFPHSFARANTSGSGLVYLSMLLT